MAHARHDLRLQKLEASKGLSDTVLPFLLSEWVGERQSPCFEPEEVEGANFDELKSIALDNLVRAGEIQARDRERVLFIVRTIARPDHRRSGANEFGR